MASACDNWRETNLGGDDGHVVVWISDLPGFHQPFNSKTNFEKSCKTITTLCEDIGSVKECLFQKRRGTKRVSVYIQFEKGSVDPEFLEILREDGTCTFSAPINNKQSWNYHVHVSKFEFVTAEERRRRRKSNENKMKSAKFSLKKIVKKVDSVSLESDDENVLSE